MKALITFSQVGGLNQCIQLMFGWPLQMSDRYGILQRIQRMKGGKQESSHYFCQVLLHFFTLLCNKTLEKEMCLLFSTPSMISNTISQVPPVAVKFNDVHQLNPTAQLSQIYLILDIYPKLQIYIHLSLGHLCLDVTNLLRPKPNC